MKKEISKCTECEHSFVANPCAHKTGRNGFYICGRTIVVKEKVSPVDGNIKPASYHPCFIARTDGWIGARVWNTCGLEGRFFKQKACTE